MRRAGSDRRGGAAAGRARRAGRRCCAPTRARRLEPRAARSSCPAAAGSAARRCGSAAVHVSRADPDRQRRRAARRHHLSPGRLRRRQLARPTSCRSASPPARRPSSCSRRRRRRWWRRCACAARRATSTACCSTPWRIRASPRRCCSSCSRRRGLRGGSGELERRRPGALRAARRAARRAAAGVGAAHPAEQHLGHLRSEAGLQALPPPAAGPQPGARDRHLPHRARPRSPHIAPVAGALVYQPAKGEPSSLAILQGFVRNEGDAWAFTLDEIERFLDQAITHAGSGRAAGTPAWCASRAASRPTLARELLGAQLEWARLLGRAHRRAAPGAERATDRPRTSRPEPMTRPGQRGLYQSIRNLRTTTFRLARERLRDLPDGARRRRCATVLALEPKVAKVFHALLERRITCSAHPLPRRLPPRPGAVHRQGLRHHRLRGRAGALAGRAPAARGWRCRTSPGMLRSFHYAAYTVLAQHVASGVDAGGARALAALLVRVGRVGLPEGLPEARRRRRLPAPRRRRRSTRCCRSSCSRSASTSSATSSTTGPTGCTSRRAGCASWSATE